MSRHSQLAGMTVVITGASSGIGRATALRFAHLGANTVIAARNANKLDAVRQEIEAEGATCLAVPTDVSNLEQVRVLVSAAVDRFGGIDVLFNNAGHMKLGAADDENFAAATRDMLEIDLFGTINCTQAVLPVMRSQGRGHIVNMSSVMGRKAFARAGGYAIAMHGVSAYSDALRQELRGTSIGVSVIHPALTQTGLLAHEDPASMPSPFRHYTPLTAEAVANGVVRATLERRPRLVLPVQPNMLLLGDAMSPRIGDLIARLLENKTFASLLGVYRGTVYRHSEPPQQPA